MPIVGHSSKMKLKIDDDFNPDDNELITLCVGNHTFYASLATLSYHSEYIKTQLDGESAMFFMEFSDIPEIFELCLVLLNGREVEITVLRFKGFLKFAVLYKVETLYAELLLWLTEKFEQKGIEFTKIHEFGRLALSFDPARKEVMDVCRNLLEEKGLFIIEQELDLLPENSFDNNFLELLVDPCYIWLTLPLLQKLIINREKAELVLKLVKNPRLLATVTSNKAFTQSFLPHLGSMLVESTPKHLLVLIKIQEKLISAIPTSPYRILPLLSCPDILGSPANRAKFLAMSPDRVLKIQNTYKFKHIVYCELLVCWLKARINENTKKVPFIKKAWEYIDFTELSRGFVFDFKGNLEKLCPGEKLTLILPPHNRNYSGCGFYLTPHQTHALRLGNPISLLHHCNIGSSCSAENKQSLCLQLTDDTPCYTVTPAIIPLDTHQHKLPVHWWFSLDSEIVSLITNTMKEVCDILATAQQIYVCVMIPIVDNPVVSGEELVIL